MSQLSLTDALSMTPEQCRDYVGKHRITDPHPYMLGKLTDPIYRVWVRALRAK